MRVNDSKPLDLGSLRAGGATWALSMTEDAELIRRRGRWISAKTMEIYIQELSASTFLTALDPTVRNNILMLARLFPVLLRQSQSFSNSCIAQNAWRFFIYNFGCGRVGEMQIFHVAEATLSLVRAGRTSNAVVKNWQGAFLCF